MRRFEPDGDWARQFGTENSDYSQGTVDADANSYMVGSTGGSLERKNAGNYDALVRKYDPEGSVLWTRQFGTTSSEKLNGAALDSHGRLYVTGSTHGSLEGQNAGSYDIFVMQVQER